MILHTLHFYPQDAFDVHGVFSLQSILLWKHFKQISFFLKHTCAIPVTSWDVSLHLCCDFFQFMPRCNFLFTNKKLILLLYLSRSFIPSLSQFYTIIQYFVFICTYNIEKTYFVVWFWIAFSKKLHLLQIFQNMNKLILAYWNLIIFGILNWTKSSYKTRFLICSKFF